MTQNWETVKENGKKHKQSLKINGKKKEGNVYHISIVKELIFWLI